MGAANVQQGGRRTLRQTGTLHKFQFSKCGSVGPVQGDAAKPHPAARRCWRAERPRLLNCDVGLAPSYHR
jgi:hypothetical protein